MAAPFDLNDDSVVVVIGTGAGGGVLSNELAQRGISVVALEAGAHEAFDDNGNLKNERTRNLLEGLMDTFVTTCDTLGKK